MLEFKKDSFVGSLASFIVEDFALFEDSLEGSIGLGFGVELEFTSMGFEASIKASFVKVKMLEAASFMEFRQVGILINQVFPLESKLMHKFKPHEEFKLGAPFHI